MAWSALTHEIHQKLSREDLVLPGPRLLLLMSGGADSLALARVLLELRQSHGFELSIGHCHHGPGVNDEYRDRALAFCEKWAGLYQLQFLSAVSDVGLTAEEECRDFRRAQVLRWKEEGAFSALVTAHTQDDLLETRFFRLCRGTGAEGLLAMKVFDHIYWRPFLGVTRKQVREHLLWVKEFAQEDPSNLDLKFRRNQIRHEVFPLLESMMPGAVVNFGASLERILTELNDHKERLCEQSQDFSKGISLQEYLTLSVIQQRQWLAQYLMFLGVRDFKHTHLFEIQKHLDICEIEPIFRVAGCTWTINAGQILALRKETSNHS